MSDGYPRRMCDQCPQLPPRQVTVPADSFTFWPSACRADCRCPTCRPDIYVTAALPIYIGTYQVRTSDWPGVRP